MPRKKITTEQFIIRAREVHGLRYSYSNVNYNGSFEKVSITCHVHGEFLQSPATHLNGSGCRSCYISKTTSTTEDFIGKAKLIHGDEYDYSSTEYTHSHGKVKIICSKHGAFMQLATDHLTGKGCLKCFGTEEVDFNIFMSRATKTHGSRYNYSAVEYSGYRNKVKITCRVHGEFLQSASKHCSGQNCPLCALIQKGRKRANSLSDFIINSKATHGDRYDYSKSIYTGALRKLKIICREHGEFEQVASDHQSGRGCPSCAKSGFNHAKLGFIYFLISDRGVKVGISNKPKQRMQQLKSRTPFDFHLIAKVKTTGAEAMRKEKYYHDKYESAGLTGFDGATEWLRYSPELMNEIMNENHSI